MERFDYAGAAPQFEKVLERDPTNGDAHYFLGLISAGLGRRLEAERHFYRILPSSSKFDRREYCLGLVALRDLDWEGAAPLMARAAAAAPSDLSARQANAYVLRRTGMAAAAGRELEDILRRDPTNAFARAEQAFASASPGRVPAPDGRGVRAAPAGVPRAGDRVHEAPRLGRGRAGGPAGHREGRARPAAALLRRLRRTRAGSLRSRGRAAGPGARAQELRLDIFPFRSEDVDVLNAAVRADPEDANALVLLGDLLYSRERRGEAIELWRRAVAAAPQHFFALRDLGMALLAGGHEGRGAPAADPGVRNETRAPGHGRSPGQRQRRDGQCRSGPKRVPPLPRAESRERRAGGETRVAGSPDGQPGPGPGAHDRAQLRGHPPVLHAASPVPGGAADPGARGVRAEECCRCARPHPGGGPAARQASVSTTSPRSQVPACCCSRP